jgi:hypothetical protein
MTSGDGAALVRRAVEEIWNRGDLDLGDALFAPTYVNHEGVIADLVRGPEAIKLSVALYRTAFPALHITIEDLVAAGDRVALRWSTRVQAPPEETSSDDDALGTVTGMTLCRLAGGQIVETWTCMNPPGARRQIGPTVELSPDGADGQRPSSSGPGPPNGRGRRRAAARFSRLCYSLSALRKAGGK